MYRPQDRIPGQLTMHGPVPPDMTAPLPVSTRLTQASRDPRLHQLLGEYVLH